MMILFGWGKVTDKKYGATLAANCPNCNNDTWLQLSRLRKWFTLFFIPVIPYSSNHLLLCEVCAQGVKLKGEQVQRAKQLNGLTQEYFNDRLSKADYQVEANKIEVLA